MGFSVKVEKLKMLLKSNDTKIIRTLLPRGQDPFVLYPKTYQLTPHFFKTVGEVKKFFKGKNIVAGDVSDREKKIVVMAYVSNPQEDFAKLIKRKNRAENEQSTN